MDINQSFVFVIVLLRKDNWNSVTDYVEQIRLAVMLETVIREVLTSNLDRDNG
jgi:hypothetical protein